MLTDDKFVLEWRLGLIERHFGQLKLPGEERGNLALINVDWIFLDFLCLIPRVWTAFHDIVGLLNSGEIKLLFIKFLLG